MRDSYGIKSLLCAGVERITFPDEDFIENGYRGETMEVVYSLFPEPVAEANGIELTGATKEWVLSNLPEYRKA